jgi:hypothetical protein
VTGFGRQMRSSWWTVEATLRPALPRTRPVEWLISRRDRIAAGRALDAGALGPDERDARGSDLRSVSTVLLAIAAILCLFLGNLALWMRQDVYSARNVNQEAQRIVGSPDVQGAVANLLTTKVVQPVLVEPALSASGLGLLSGLVKAPLTTAAQDLIEHVMATQPAQHVAARLVEQVVPELDSGSGPISLSPQQLFWIASPSLASNHLVATILHSAERTSCCQVVLAQRQSLSFGWRHVGMIRTAGVVLPALFFAFAALGLGIARRRGRLVMVLAGATALTGLATLISLLAGPHFWSGLMVGSGSSAGVVRAIDRTTYDGATAALRGHSLAIAVLGAGVLAGVAAARYFRPRLMTGPGGGAVVNREGA